MAKDPVTGKEIVVQNEDPNAPSVVGIIGEDLPPIQPPPAGFVWAPTLDRFGRKTWTYEQDPSYITPAEQARIAASLASAGVGAGISAAESARQFNIRQPQLEAESRASIAKIESDIANTKRAQDFIEKKWNFESSLGLTKEANDTQQRLFENQISLQNMINQRNTLQAQMQMQAATENARNQLATQQANLQYQAQREARLQALAGDIGKLAADPGSRAQLAATLLANRAFGQAPGALRQSQVTEESLQPLAQDLSLKKSIEAQPLNPYQYTPIQAPTLAPIDMTQFQLPKFITTTPPAPTTAPTAPGAPGPNLQQLAAAANGDVTGAGGASGYAAALKSLGYTQQAPESAPATSEGSSPSAMAKGGVTRAKNFLVGDSKDGTPTGYEEMIVNPMGAPIEVVPNEMIARYRAPMPRFANGTADDPTGSVFGTEMQDTSAARNFLSQAIQRALAGTPWTTSSLPTSVYASTPGMDPSVVQLMASLNAQARGVPSETFLRQASILAPSGMGQQVTRRTA